MYIMQFYCQNQEMSNLSRIETCPIESFGRMNQEKCVSVQCYVYRYFQQSPTRLEQNLISNRNLPQRKLCTFSITTLSSESRQDGMTLLSRNWFQEKLLGIRDWLYFCIFLQSPVRAEMHSSNNFKLSHRIQRLFVKEINMYTI